MPAQFHWERTRVGGDARDHFAQGLLVKGRNLTLRGGVLNGNLENRHVISGPAVAGFAATRRGCALTRRGPGFSARYSRAGVPIAPMSLRRPSSSTAHSSAGAGLAWPSWFRGKRDPTRGSDPIRFVNCRFIGNSRYPDNICNNPGAGIDIENEDGTAAVQFVNCFFAGYRTYAIYLSNGARDTLVQGCVIHGRINLQPSNLGGHRFINNYFGPGSYLYAVYGHSTDAPSALIGNTFENTLAVIFRNSADYPNGWTIALNTFLGPADGRGPCRPRQHVRRCGALKFSSSDH